MKVRIFFQGLERTVDLNVSFNSPVTDITDADIRSTGNDPREYPNIEVSGDVKTSNWRLIETWYGSADVTYLLCAFDRDA